MKKILVIDDDIVIRKMIIELIESSKLGTVVGELEDGIHAVDEIQFYNPDIVVVDLLLPGKDGINIVKTSLENGFKGKFIMISQVEDQYMISKAYEAGCVFFLGKPINAIEAISVIRTVSSTLDLERSFQLIKSTVIGMPGMESGNALAQAPSDKPSLSSQLDQIFSDLGIISDSGTEDLRAIIMKILKLRKTNPTASYKLQDLYNSLSEEKASAGRDYVNSRSIEQRIRRIILKAMTTLAEMGREDFDNLKFTDYATVLFDLGQIKQEIRYIENESTIRGKISVKRFIEGMMSKLKY
ncbi:DNA-binding domain-containing protein [Fusibacter sp. JL216-2]|uniref:DNA-binding domain-containing protein n=1 Tax=Fusibacter sp. JL216-2 TaxID=3071453 RepID=UPI003D33682B